LKDVGSTKTLPSGQIKQHGMQAEKTKSYKLSGSVSSKLLEKKTPLFLSTVGFQASVKVHYFMLPSLGSLARF
jgi:hypothetical protein